MPRAFYAGRPRCGGLYGYSLYTATRTYAYRGTRRTGHRQTFGRALPAHYHYTTPALRSMRHALQRHLLTFTTIPPGSHPPHRAYHAFPRYAPYPRWYGTTHRTHRFAPRV